MFPVNVVGIDGELQYGELERTAQSLDKGTAYRVMLGTDTTITEVDGSRILSTWQIVWQCHYISTLCFGAHLLSVGDLLNLYHTYHTYSACRTCYTCHIRRRALRWTKADEEKCKKSCSKTCVARAAGCGEEGGRGKRGSGRGCGWLVLSITIYASNSNHTQVLWCYINCSTTIYCIQM